MFFSKKYNIDGKIQYNKIVDDIQQQNRTQN